MNYQEALDYILRFADYERLPRSGIVWDLKRIERLLARLGNPAPCRPVGPCRRDEGERQHLRHDCLDPEAGRLQGGALYLPPPPFLHRADTG